MTHTAYMTNANRQVRIHMLLGVGVVVVGGLVATSVYSEQAHGQSSVVTECATIRTVVDAIDNTYAPPFGFFSDLGTLRVHAYCTSSGADITVGTGSPSQYIYQYGYVSKEGKPYERVALTGLNKTGEWLVGSARAVVPVESNDTSYAGTILTYVCDWTSGGWRCGCSDVQCAAPHWTAQTYEFNAANEPASPEDTIPIIESISPTSVDSDYARVTITGKNFTAENNTILISTEGPAPFTNIPSENGTTISFRFHLKTFEAFQEILEPYQGTGQYTRISEGIADNILERLEGYDDSVVPVTVTVQNKNGTSKPAVVLVNLTNVFASF